MPISNEPNDSHKISLRRWRVMEIEAPNGTRSRHVWGHDVKKGRGLASSPIIEFNLNAMIAVTRSGSNYRLLGLPGNSRLGRHAWKQWCRENEVVSQMDVTIEYLNIDHLSTVDLTKFNSSAD
jgi:hypothetical protein